MPLLCPCATAGSTESNQLITLSGLTGSLSNDIDGDLQQAPFLLTSTLDSGDQTSNLDSVGKWTRATGELVIDLGAVGPSYTPCSTLAFTFTLLNSNAAKPAANVFASIPALPFTCTGCGEQCSAPQALTLMPGGEKPLLVRTGSIRYVYVCLCLWPCIHTCTYISKKYTNVFLALTIIKTRTRSRAHRATMCQTSPFGNLV